MNDFISFDFDRLQYNEFVTIILMIEDKKFNNNDNNSNNRSLKSIVEIENNTIELNEKFRSILEAFILTTETVSLFILLFELINSLN